MNQTESRIEVTEEGLTTLYYGSTHTIRWDEARTFATYKTYDSRWFASFTNQYTRTKETYELSNERIIVRWSKQSYMAAFQRIEPALTPMEYARLLQALNQLVAAKTGLPLYDLDQII